MSEHKFPSFDDFHNFVMWGQKENKKNPGKFGTIEMYTYLSYGFHSYLNECKKEGKDINQAMSELLSLIKVKM